VLREGVVQQVDAPENIYHSPANRFVATVVGSPPMNFIAVKVTSANGRLRAEHASFVVESLGDSGESMTELAEGGVCYVGIRPEDVTIVREGQGIPTTVYATEPLGGETIVDLELGRQVIKSIAPPAVDLQTDAKVAIRLDAQRIHVFDAGGRAVMSAAGAEGVFGVSFV
jgi:multiple sugar transport system ATP-binding protein